jgi:hypothetical protein
MNALPDSLWKHIGIMGGTVGVQGNVQRTALQHVAGGSGQRQTRPKLKRGEQRW